MAEEVRARATSVSIPFGVAPGQYYLTATSVAMKPEFTIDGSANAGPEDD